MLRLSLQATGMEFASEIVVKATLSGYRVEEVPTTLSPDGRSRPPHLRSWRDGWRHLGSCCSSAHAGYSSIQGCDRAVSIATGFVVELTTVRIGGAVLGVDSLVVFSRF